MEKCEAGEALLVALPRGLNDMFKRFVMAFAAVVALLPAGHGSADAGLTQPTQGTGVSDQNQRSTGGMEEYDKKCDQSSPPSQPAPPRKILHIFDGPHGSKVALRCGVRNPTPDDDCHGWGYRHIRCGHWFNILNPGYIQTTLLHPHKQKVKGNSHVRVHWFNKKKDVWYRVVWSTRKSFPGTDHPHKGIITAFMNGL